MDADEEEINRISDAIDTCFNFIDKERQALHNKLFDVPAKKVFTFEQIVPVLESHKDPDEKIKYIRERMNYHNQELAQYPDRYVDDGGTFIKRCNLEINHIKKLKQERIRQKSEKATQPKSDLSFEEIFRDYHNNKSEMADRIISLLKREKIIDIEGVWKDDPMDIRGLYLAMLEYPGKIKLKVRKPFVLYRICFRKFKLKEKDAIKETSRNRAPIEVLEKYKNILNLI
ncbi:hypothetical protein AAE02nite_18630 [Adhaeribacter aerolatus]|uniref:Uncharacterized protein n=2 Tax=Adhaeribacter aerolatus TaxID=670289 RepID=A0A512AWU8_9BACT|nr:hypothetical protein AAE02nite_18630 [Adhaeribacter aerolatus]